MTFLLRFSVQDAFKPSLDFLGNVNPELGLSATAFSEHFHDLTRLNIPPSAYQSVQLGDQRKDGHWLVAFFDSLRKSELTLLEETLHPSNRADSWGYSMIQSVQKRLPKHKEELEKYVFWFQIGAFEKEGVWKVDKYQILAILNQEAEDLFLHLCPSFTKSVLEESVERLPDRIDVFRSPSWEIQYENRVEGSKVVKKPVGIIHKLTLDTLIESRKAQVKKEVQRSLEAQKTNDSTTERKRSIPNVSFDEIGGIEPIIKTVREVVELPLKNPELFQYMNIKPHRGILLYGPPGCGKTMIAKAIAHDIQAHFISVKGPELLNKYYGQSEENLRQLFDEASEMQPSIIFFDEIDAVAQKRSGEDNLRIEAKFVNQLLTMMDGIEDYGSVCVIAATNRPELLDSALLRPGRFDYQLHVPKPDLEGCKKIFRINTKNMPIDKSFKLDDFAAHLEGLTGAEIAFITREAAFNCLRRNYDVENDGFETLSQLKTFNHLKIVESDFLEARKRLETKK